MKQDLNILMKLLSTCCLIGGHHNSLPDVLKPVTTTTFNFDVSQRHDIPDNTSGNETERLCYPILPTVFKTQGIEQNLHLRHIKNIGSD